MFNQNMIIPAKNITLCRIEFVWRGWIDTVETVRVYKRFVEAELRYIEVRYSEVLQK